MAAHVTPVPMQKAYTPGLFAQEAAWKRALVESLPALSAPTCVDISRCGADLGALLAAKYPDGRVLDLALAPLKAGSVDILAGCYALQETPDLWTLLEDVHRVLKPGGVAAFIDFSKPSLLQQQKLHYRFLKIWGGLRGLLQHRDTAAYAHVAESHRRFPDRLHLREILFQKGFLVTASHRFFGGLTEALYLRKTGK